MFTVSPDCSQGGDQSVVIHYPLKKLPEDPQHCQAELARTVILGEVRNLTFFFFFSTDKRLPQRQAEFISQSVQTHREMAATIVFSDFKH